MRLPLLVTSVSRQSQTYAYEPAKPRRPLQVSDPKTSAAWVVYVHREIDRHYFIILEGSDQAQQIIERRDYRF